MNEELMAQVNKVINEQLPSQVGEALKKRLTQADLESKQLKDVMVRNETLTKEKEELVKAISGFKALESQLEHLQALKRETDLKLLKLELQELKVAQADLRVKDMKEIVGMVFANNKFKYNTCTSETVPSGQYGVQSVNTSKYVEGEG